LNVIYREVITLLRIGYILVIVVVKSQLLR
jgi:hypothetical protein